VVSGRRRRVRSRTSSPKSEPRFKGPRTERSRSPSRIRAEKSADEWVGSSEGEESDRLASKAWRARCDRGRRLHHHRGARRRLLATATWTLGGEDYWEEFRLGKRETLRAQVRAVEPVADVAFLGCPDDQ
jgi:hypothetical protein